LNFDYGIFRLRLSQSGFTSSASDNLQSENTVMLEGPQYADRASGYAQTGLALFYCTISELLLCIASVADINQLYV
jgi:hypothetical protein